MNDRYLFRGKCKKTGKWYFGDLDQAYGFSRIKYLVIGGKGGYRTVECIPETVGQFTRLKDSNGKLIFEGDIVKDDNGKIFFIAFEISSFMLVTKQNNMYDLVDYAWNNNSCPLSHWYWENYCTENCLRNLEVIGNIFDDGEFLGGIK